jgi:23S rRNA (cytosine1962-C5)-methyltransferase
MIKLNKIILKPGRSKSVEKGHPWIFSGAIKKVEGNPSIGETIDIFSAEGNFLAKGFYSPHSQIRARVWTLENIEVEEQFFREQIESSFRRRLSLNLIPYKSVNPKEFRILNNSARVINSESDNLPGLIVDFYNDFLVLQALTAGVEKNKTSLVNLLKTITGIENVFERSDSDERKLEGLTPVTGVLAGVAPPQFIEIIENEIRFFVDIISGHKTGFYLDQRDNRFILREFSGDKEILNCFSYTGGFTLNALAGGAKKVISVDSSEKALEIAKNNVSLNRFATDRCEWIGDDVFKVLREYRDTGRKFDTIILDPPKFASGKGSVDQALRGYKDINMLALRILKPEGILFTFSCSGNISEEMFQKSVAWASIDAKVQARIIKRLGQASDHPVALNFPESSYLKGFIIQK